MCDTWAIRPLLPLQVLTAKRATIIAAINGVEAARQEEEWLAAFESDEQRYKVGGGRGRQGSTCPASEI